MKITALGTRGGIPVSGPLFAEFGGYTTSFWLDTVSQTRVVIDAGTGITQLNVMDGFFDVTTVNLLLTHLHIDHISGLPFFKILQMPGKTLNIWGPESRPGQLKQDLMALISPPYFPISLNDFPATVNVYPLPDTDQFIDGIEIGTVPLTHPGGGVGYRVSESGNSAVFLSDNELGERITRSTRYSDYVAFCEGAAIAFLDAEYTDAEYVLRRGWGHSSWKQAIELANEASLPLLGAVHHHQFRQDEDILALAQNHQQIARKSLQIEPVRCGQSFLI